MALSKAVAGRLAQKALVAQSVAILAQSISSDIDLVIMAMKPAPDDRH